ncbi:MAG TPA: c-type cytochrome [Candidatus Sulfotelmatobacter sp.]
MKDVIRIAVLGMLSTGIICGVVLKAAKAQSGALQASSTSSAPKMAEEQFKNIQVLKGVPADQLIPAMQFITASLGVECDFCHVQGAMDKDDKKPKKTARLMMQMMFAINKDNFNGNREVTCYSCHRGSTDPVGTPIIAAEEPKMTPGMMPMANENEVAKPSGPSADELIDKYVQALGGAKAVDKITSRVVTGTIDFGGASYAIDVYSKDPNKRASFVHMPEGDNITAFNGQEGWLAAPKRPVRQMHGADLDGASMDADLHFATHLKQMFTQAEVLGNEKIDDHETYLVVGRREGKPPLRLYFGTQSGLLLRLVRYAETPLGRLPTQIDYADYRDVNGVKAPFRWTLARPSGRFTIQAKDVKQNIPVDDAKFAMPAGMQTPPEPSK